MCCPQPPKKLVEKKFLICSLHIKYQNFFVKLFCDANNSPDVNNFEQRIWRRLKPNHLNDKLGKIIRQKFGDVTWECVNGKENRVEL